MYLHSTKENEFSNAFFSLPANDFHVHTSILQLHMELKAASPFYVVPQKKKAPKQTRWQMRKGTEGADHSKRKSKHTQTSKREQIWEPEWERRQQKNLRGQVAWREMSHFSPSHTSSSFFIFIFCSLELKDNRGTSKAVKSKDGLISVL